MSRSTILLSFGLIIASSVAAQGTSVERTGARVIALAQERGMHVRTSIALRCDADVLLYNYKGRRPKG